jgi:hypothetical protein
LWCAALFLFAPATTTQGLTFTVVENCNNPLGTPGGTGVEGVRVPGIAVHASASEFYSSFASIFRLSDGSTISVPAQERTESLEYIQGMLKSVGVYVNKTDTTAHGDVLQICGKDVVDMLLLAVVGNFVASPGDPNISPQSSMKSMPSVVIDAYTGQLVMHTPYDAVRGYFVEALLVISIIVISRLTFVRNNVYTTTFQVVAPTAASSTAVGSSAK